MSTEGFCHPDVSTCRQFCKNISFTNLILNIVPSTDLNATTMLGQAKTVIQAEIDAAAEMIDFFRFNAFFGKELLKYQPISEQPESTLNLMRYRSLEGFVASISPFNFTAIAGNLGYTPAIMVRIKFVSR